MIQHRHKVAGEPVQINVVENEDDLPAFRNFIRENLGLIGFDTETTGLGIYGAGFRLRLVQFGTGTTSFVVPTERGPRFEEDARLALQGVKHVVAHNASYDLQVIEQTLGIPMEQMWPKTTDTRILAHLVDPRGREEGGIGHSLADLTRHYIDAGVADGVKSLMRELAKKYKTTKEKVWAAVPFEDPDYQLYAGMDPILAYRLRSRLADLVPARSKPLIEFEHQVAEVCAAMERTGFLLDVEYTQALSEKLTQRQEWFTEIAAQYGCENVNATEQVADVLEAQGVVIPGRTPTGRRKVDKVLLDSLVERGDKFAQAVVEAKKARKWRETWVNKFLSTRDGDDRCHASINALRARTARMSITGIPAQTLPSKDHLIRRCFLADEGHLTATIDYKAQELRVLASLAGDEAMISIFRTEGDLHDMTAAAAFGPNFTKQQRGYAKIVNFGRVYGGGVGTVAEQTGLDRQTAKRVLDAFDAAYPRVTELSKRLQREARQNGCIYTPTGRRLPVDPTRAYSALNYLIQSSSRDVTGRALVRLHDAGYTPYLRLPIHDEVLASVPNAAAEWGAGEIGRIMAEQMGEVLIDTDPEVGGRSWGSLYGADY